ncbi:hypothetical protein DPEC_G00175570 [Dallia pectoralis]|uniref:Uncharacterized protein n=1 Tax=Dallia pectoralis TaxID=75939 RepID=A0ACC2GEU1_DALPE|nr:hypothetical protein DPEC_G00175570 [Dallia pectoralis]
MTWPRIQLVETRRFLRQSKLNIAMDYKKIDNICPGAKDIKIKDLLDLIIQHLNRSGEETMDGMDEDMGVASFRIKENSEQMEWIPSSNPNFCNWRESRCEDEEYM